MKVRLLVQNAHLDMNAQILQIQPMLLHVIRDTTQHLDPSTVWNALQGMSAPLDQLLPALQDITMLKALQHPALSVLQAMPAPQLVIPL